MYIIKYLNQATKPLNHDLCKGIISKAVALLGKTQASTSNATEQVIFMTIMADTEVVITSKTFAPISPDLL